MHAMTYKRNVQSPATVSPQPTSWSQNTTTFKKFDVHWFKCLKNDKSFHWWLLGLIVLIKMHSVFSDNLLLIFILIFSWGGNGSCRRRRSQRPSGAYFRWNIPLWFFIFFKKQKNITGFWVSLSLPLKQGPPGLDGQVGPPGLRGLQVGSHQGDTRLHFIFCVCNATE